MRVADKSMAGKARRRAVVGADPAPIRNLPNPATVQFDGIVHRHHRHRPGLPCRRTLQARSVPNHYVQAVNSAFRVWDRNRCRPDGDHSVFDAVRHAVRRLPHGERRRSGRTVRPARRRWLISQFCTLADPNNHQLIAISKTGLT